MPPPFSLGFGLGLPFGGASPTLLSADFTALPVGAVSVLPAGIQHSRASNAWVQTSASQVSGALANDVAGVGNDGVGNYLAFDESRVNVDTDGRTQTGFGVGGGATLTAASETGADGTVNAAGRVNAPANGFCFKAFASLGAPKYVLSGFLRSRSATGPVQLSWGGSAQVNAGNATQSTTFARFATVATTPAGGSANVFPCETRVGIAGPMDLVADFMSAEAGSFATEPMATAGGAFTRAGARLWLPTGAAAIDQGRITLEVSMRPKGGNADYSVNAFLAAIDANNFIAYLLPSGTMRTSVASVTYTAPATPTWAPGDVVDFFIAAGGGTLPTVIKYRKNGGAAITLSTGSPPIQAAFVAPTTMDILNLSSANQFSARVLKLAFYRSGSSPAWAA